MSTSVSTPALSERVDRRPFCYLIMAHAEPDRVARLADGIRATSPHGVIATAYNGPLTTAERSRLHDADVHVVGTGRPAGWGAWSLVERVLEGMRDVMPLEWSWLVLVSGQCYPITHLGRWEQATLTRGVSGLVRAKPVQPDNLDLVERYTFRWLELPFVGRPDGLRYRGVMRMLRWLSDRSRVITWRTPRDAVWVGVRIGRSTTAGLWEGSQWVALDRSAVATLLAQHAGGADRRFRHTFIADEVYVPTLLRGAGVALADEAVSTVFWDEETDRTHPRELGPEDLDLLLAATTPFARKLTGSRGRDLAARLDAVIGARQDRMGGPAA